MLKKTRKAQTITEYAIMLGVVIAALTAMNTFTQRGLQGRLSTGVETAAGVSGSISPSMTEAEGAGSVPLGVRTQYEPYYLASDQTSYQESITDTRYHEGAVEQHIVSQMQATEAGGYRGALGGTADDGHWKSWEEK